MRFYPSGLLGRRTWSELWVAVRRVHKDRQAAIFVLRLAAAVLYFGAWLLFTTLAWFHDIGSRGVAFVVCLSISVAASIYFIHQWTESREQKRIRDLGPDVSHEITQALLNEARMLAFLLDRVGSERFGEKKLPPGFEVVTRRVHREKLRTTESWEILPSLLRDLLLLPDGAWNLEQKQAAETCLEYFVVLRWVLRFDSSLPPLDRRAEYSIKDAQQVLDPIPGNRLPDTLPPWDVRASRNETDQRFNRYWIEAIARGLIRPDDPHDGSEGAKSIKQSIDSNLEVRDLLMGANTVSELKDQQLGEEIVRCFHRWQILNVLVPVLAAEKPASAVRELWVSQISPDAVAQD
jgi:hypothetical protein